MADFKMPSLGADMDAATLTEWRVKVGDRVKRGDLIATVETVKGAIDVEVFLDGVVEALLVEPGATVPVDTVLAMIRTEGEASAAPVAGAPPTPPAAAAPPPPTAPVPAAPSDEPPSHLRASPAARRLAEAKGVDLSALHGSGPDGAIILSDVEQAVASRSGAPAARPFDVAAMRGAIAAAMSRSKQEIPHYYLSTEIDLFRATAWLEQRNAGRTVAERVLLAALLLKATALAVREVPEVNGHFVGGAFAPAASVHLGVATHLRAGGLVAPALRDAETLPLVELMARLSDLVDRARKGGLKASEMSSATLTVTSLGEQGVTAVFPIIHPPQVAMVGFGRVVSRPWVVDGAVAPRPIVVASLAADHRVSDGHRGARFLSAIDRLLQAPEAL